MPKIINSPVTKFRHRMKREGFVRVEVLVRKQDAPQRYQIAIGSRWWKVDESENTVITGDSPWFRNPEKQVDLLGLLDVGVKEASALLSACRCSMP